MLQSSNVNAWQSLDVMHVTWQRECTHQAIEPPALLHFYLLYTDLQLQRCSYPRVHPHAAGQWMPIRSKGAHERTPKTAPLAAMQACRRAHTGEQMRQSLSLPVVLLIYHTIHSMRT